MRISEALYLLFIFVFTVVGVSWLSRHPDINYIILFSFILVGLCPSFLRVTKKRGR